MLSHYIADIDTQERLRRESFGADLDGFASWLAARRYSKATIRSYIRAASKFSAWIHTTGRPSSVLDRLGFCDYRSHLRQQRRGERAHDIGNDYCGARRFAQYLRQVGSIAFNDPPAGTKLEQGFCHWLDQHRGAAAATIAGHARRVRRLVDALGSEPHLYTAAQLRAFVLTQARGYSHSHAESLVSTVRMFIRYLVVHQRCPEGLQYAIPRVAGWQHASLPRYLDRADVESVIEACDPSDPLGARDRAVLLLLARLGLRAGDVAGLRLPDIDWAEARLSVSGKSRRPTWLPLPQDAGDALLHYLQTARPSVSHDAVFVITRAPYTGIIARQVSSTAERAIRRAGVQAPSYGAHLFRHSAATGWLRDGLTLQAIGSVLRHRDLDTTAIYAKVDVNALKRIALPWPREDASC